MLLCVVCIVLCVFFFFFKQKTAYEMRISDWSSDVCSSDLVISPIAAEAVRRIDAIFAIERTLTGSDAAVRQAQRQTGIAPLLADLERWLRDERDGLARQNPVARAIDYILTDWSAFTRVLHDGPLCLANHAAARTLEGIHRGGKGGR